MPIASSITAAIIAGAATGGSAIYASSKGSGAAKDAARYQTQSSNYAADLEAKAAERALEFTRQQEAQRQKEWAETQTRNRAIYDAEVARDQGRYDDLQSRMQPYRQFGAGAIGQIARPIYPQAPGSLGARMGA